MGVVSSRSNRAETGIVNPLFWILVAPLAWALALCLAYLARERDPRLLPTIGLLGALAAAEWFIAPRPPLGLAELAASGHFVPLLGFTSLNLLAALSAVVATWSLRERNQAEQRRWLDLELLHDLPDATLRPGGKLEADLARLLASGCHQLDCDVGIVSRVEDGTWEIRAVHGSLPFQTGDRLPLRATFCANTLVQETPVAWDSAQERPPECPLRFERTLGVALRLAGHPVGTLFLGRSDLRGDPFSSAQERQLVLVAQAVIARLALEPDEFSSATSSAAFEATPHKTATSLSSERRLELEPSIRRLEKSLVASLAPGVSLSLQLDDDEAEVRLASATLGALLFSLVRHAESCFDENDPGTLTLESSRIDAVGGPGETPGFATLSVHAPCSGALDSVRVAQLFEASPTQHPEVPSLSELRQALQAQDGDLSAHSASGVGVTLTLFLPLCSTDVEKSRVPHYAE